MICLGIIYDRLRWEEKELSKSADARGLDVNRVDAKTISLDSDWSSTDTQDKFGNIVLQRCISYFRGLHTTAFLESKGLKVINSMDVALTCGNKLLTTLKLEKANVPTPRTLFSFTAEGAIESLQTIGYPAVLKPVTGSWGRMVVKLNDKETAQAMIEMRSKIEGPLNQIFYIQEMVDRPPRDIRTIVAGDKIVASIYRHASPGEWRTNVSIGGKGDICKVTSELEDVVLRAADTVGGGLLGVDAMESENGILIHEINNTVEFKGAASVCGVDIANEIISYILAQNRR
ncbi:MAG: lysine biosynthesis protein LysX [Nitrososphaerales archaeon]|jgi:[lysine-biosynthesis-protein LysW]--L-2-aminoadipate ligase|nr:lysine biosynthesis protein LysX [Nitrososphaerales archaeon]